MLVVSNPTRPKNVTGVEREYGTYVWNHRTDSEIRVVRVIPRFGISGNDRDSIQHSPSKLLVFERSGNREIGCMEITDTVQKHQYFGYFLKPQPLLSRLNIGDIIPEDTILSQSPNVNEVGDWRPGRESPVVFMSLPQVIEDGVVACKEDMEYFKHWRFSNVVMQADGLWIPLNLYGTEDRYQPFPDIGDRIRSDGLIFALRKWDPDTAFVRLTPKALMRFDNAFDQTVGTDKISDVREWLVTIFRTIQVQRYPQPVSLHYDVREPPVLEILHVFFTGYHAVFNDLRKRHKDHRGLTTRAPVTDLVHVRRLRQYGVFRNDIADVQATQ
jgi:hypothetical protein